MSGENSLTSNVDIEISNQDGVATMRLRRPRVRNAITLAMWEATASLFAGFGADEKVRAVILTGEKPDFSVGADISEFSRVRATAEQSAAYEEAVDAASEAIARCPKPGIPGIHGLCLGGGRHLRVVA